MEENHEPEDLQGKQQNNKLTHIASKKATYFCFSSFFFCALFAARSASTIVPTWKVLRIFFASSECPTSSNASVASLPPNSIKTSSPPVEVQLKSHQSSIAFWSWTKIRQNRFGDVAKAAITARAISLYLDATKDKKKLRNLGQISKKHFIVFF